MEGISRALWPGVEASLVDEEQRGGSSDSDAWLKIGQHKLNKTMPLGPRRNPFFSFFFF
jgi:hypothetical protein